jgi:hypothetical protein
MMVTYSSSVGSATHKVPPSNRVLTMNIVDILTAALNINLRELGGTPGERGKVAPYDAEFGAGVRRGVVGL